MKLLVTGARGFVGRHVTSYLQSKGHKLIATDQTNTEANGDVADHGFVFAELKKLDFDAVIHLAAVADIRRTIEDPYTCFRVNSFGTLNLLELSRLKGVQRFIYASSANVYGVRPPLPVTETTTLDPRAPYDRSKVVAESFVRNYHQHKGLPTVILRSWLLFGEYDIHTRAIPRFVTACLDGDPLPLFNGGRDTTDPYHALNYAHAVDLALSSQTAIGEVFNVGTGRELSIRELAEKIKELTHSDSKLQLLPPRTSLEAEPMRSYPSVKKITEALGYAPVVSLDEGLRRTIEWIRTLQIRPAKVPEDPRSVSHKP